MHLLATEAQALSLPCFDLVPAQTGDRIVAHWGGRRADLPETFPSFVTALKSQHHLLSVDQSVFGQLGFTGRYPFALSIVTTAAGDERPDAKAVATGTLADATFEDTLPLTLHPAVSLPPLEALILYGGPAIGEWVADQGIKRWEYSAVSSEIRKEYEKHFYSRSPLCSDQAPVARVGGWHTLWPDDDFYTPREMRLMLWTFRDAEPWYEVFLSPQNNYVLRGRIT
jgi:hypothetical protein